MNKLLQVILVAILGFTGISASALPIKDGHYYKLRLHDVTSMYFHMPATGNAQIKSESEATVIYTEVNPSDATQCLIRRNGPDGDILGIERWNTVCNGTDDSHVWTVSEPEGVTGDYPVVRFYQAIGHNGDTELFGYLGPQASTSGSPIYNNSNPSTSTTHKVNWDVIDVTPEHAAMDRSGWEVLGCSQYGNKGGSTDGSYSDIIDNNTTTYWHTDYENDEATTGHFFIIDMKKKNNITGVGYLPRQTTDNGANGYAYDVEVYVVDDISGIRLSANGDSHSDMNTYLAGKTANCSKTINSDLTANKTYYIDLDEPAIGRYIIFRMPKTRGGQTSWGTAANNHANCAELYVYGCESSNPVITVSAANGGRAWIGDDNESTTSYEITNPEEFNAITLHAASGDYYKFSSWSLNNETVSTDSVYTITNCPSEHTWHYIAHFVNIVPVGESYRNNYLTKIESTGAKENINISYSAHPGIYNLVEGVVAEPESSFNLNLVANCISTDITNVHEDMRYNVAHVFTDWDGDGTFDDTVTKYGIEAGESGFAGNTVANYNSVMNINHAVTIPAEATSGTTARIRVIYQNAWKHNVTANEPNLDKGICYDFTILIATNNPKQAIYDAFVAEMGKYTAEGTGFATSWGNTSVEDKLNGLATYKDVDAITPDNFSTAVNQLRDEILSNITPKGFVRIVNRAHSVSSLNYNFLNTNELDIYHNDNLSHDIYPHHLWEIEYLGNGKFGLKNHYSQTYISGEKTASGRAQASESAAEVTFDFTDGGFFGLNTGNSTTPYIHYASGTGTDQDYLVANCTSNEAQWKIRAFEGVDLADDDDVVDFDDASKTLTITFKHKEDGKFIGRLSQARYYADHMVIRIEPARTGTGTSAPMRREAEMKTTYANTDLTDNIGEGSVTMTVNNVPYGNYNVSVPAGFFEDGYELTAAKDFTVSVSSAGATTSISEVGVEAVDAEGIYDLQGRRLVAPVKGINIINGKKILVK